MPTAAVKGIDLYYEEVGAGAPILGIHGTPSSVVLWREAASGLGEVGRCIIYDRRGFGRSFQPAGALDLDQHVDDAVALIDFLAAEPAVVIGRSTGGQIALALAHRHPDKVQALVLLEPALFTADPEAEAWADALRRSILTASAADPSKASETVVRRALGDEAWESLPGEVQEVFDAAAPAVLAEIKGSGLDLSAHPLRLENDELGRIEHETLLVSSEDSPAVMRRINDHLALTLPNPELVLVPGGHLIDPAHPSILRFLARVLASA